MRSSLIAYAATAVIFFGMDFIWLSLSHAPLYKAKLGGMLLDKPDLAVAGGFYLLYVVGVIVFAVLPAIEQGDVIRAIWGGALFGLVAYGTYDMTNQATLAGWSPVVTVFDMLWGTFATCVASVAGYYAVKLTS